MDDHAFHYNLFQTSLIHMIEAQLHHIRKLKEVGVDKRSLPRDFLRSYCTLSVAPAGRIGSSTLLQNLPWASNSIVMAKDALLGCMSFNAKPLAQIGSIDLLNRLSWSKEVEPNARMIFVDQPKLIPDLGQTNLSSEFYFAASKYTKLDMVVCLGSNF